MQKKLIKLVNDFPWYFLIAVISAEIGAILLILQYKQVAFFANQVMYIGKKFDSVTGILIGIVAAVFIRGIFQFFSDWFSQKMAVQIKSKLRRDLIKKATRVPFHTIQQRSVFQTLMVDGVEALDRYFSQYVPQILISIFVPISILLFVFPLDELTGWVLLLTAPLIPVFMVLIGRYSKVVTERQWTKLNRMSHFFIDSIRGIKTLLLFNQGENQVHRIKKVSEDYYEVTMKVLQIAFLSAFFLEFVSTLSTAVVAVEIGLRLLYGRLGFEEAFFILLIAPEFYLPLRNLGLRFHAGMNGVEAAKNIFAFLEQGEPRNNSFFLNQKFDWNGFKNIRFNNISVIYPESKQKVLNSASFNIPIGKSTAIIGPSGAGKSTVFQTLLRFINPVAGVVSLDDLSISEIDIDYWRKQIGWIPQKPYLYNGTLLENLKLGNPDVNFQQINQVLAQTFLRDFVARLPYGLETKLSDIGTQISSGQRQRIAIARVLLRDCQLLLFDELSASLDPIVEEQILNNLKEFSKNKTLVSIAHRLHTITSSDEIIVLNEGKVNAAGNHQFLQSHSDLYGEFLKTYFGVMA
ncbi:MAG: thiol reductant ABC exporter subunit CydD [Anaerolineaceae bacterium]|nr:thiol reductant ABC exporter subunit CydD [Anaerolineaceae bacterium]